MKILYLKLKNYATIYTAMGLKELEIDFTKSKNNVILFVGDNGSGKTSILSTLHPFPYYGSMDNRNNTNIIREDKDGFKEIHIQNDDIIYKIQHYYKNSKRGIVLKSFIQKNGEELNPNGNVTSFNEAIKTELSLELDFLKLLRLGSNVTNLIDMKSAERKSFTSYLLSDINIYTDLFKKVTDDNRVLRSMIKTVSDKLTRLNVIDRSVLDTDIKAIESKLDDLNNKKNILQQKLGSVEGKINILVPEGVDYTLNYIKELELNLKQFTSEHTKICRNIEKMCVILAYGINKEIEIIRDRLNDLENKHTLNTNMILFYTEQLSPLYNKKEELATQMKNFVSDITYRQMNNLYIEISDKVKEYSVRFKDHEPIYTKDNLINLLEILKQIDRVVSEIYTFDMRAVKKTVSMIKNHENVYKYIHDRNKEIEKEMYKITSNLKSTINTKTPYVIFKPQNCQVDDCPYLWLYDLLFNDDTKSDTSSLVSLETEKEILDSMANVNKNIEYIFMILKSNMSLISKGDISYFQIDSILNSIDHSQSIYDENYITDMISDVEDYEEYIDLKIKMKELKTELNLIKSGESNIEKLKEEINENEKSIAEILSKKLHTENENNNLSIKLEYARATYDTILQYKEYVEEQDKIHNDIINLQQELTTKNNIINSVSEFTNESKDIQKDIDLVNWEINKLNNELFDLKVKLKDFISLSREQNTLNEKFDDVMLIKESLSSTKGIPLLYMQLYLKNTKIFVNDLLKSVYADNFEIDDFDINESEFNIPYIKNNIRISDVMYASQGEKSFLSLALSFALINQSIKDYNILLLDEIDSTLDVKNRAMFLNILEKQMESISAEQVFLITHNNMFDNYPVDVILTSSNRMSNFSNANIIFST